MLTQIYVKSIGIFNFQYYISMGNVSTFPVNLQSMDRSVIHWEDTIHDLSPVETLGGLQFKREDRYAPLGYGGINGSKLRVCIWLIAQAKKAGMNGIIHGAVTGSPQHPMTAIIGKHFGMPVIDVVGTPNPADHEMLSIAKSFGATFISSKIGYAKTLESRAFAEKPADYFVLETNITVDERRNSAERVEAFHRVGSEQVRNIPDDVETMIIPAGSCNSVLGVLYGIARFKPKGLKKIILMGIGSWGSKDPSYIYRRMEIIEKVAGIPIAHLFRPTFVHDEKKQPYITAGPYELIHYNINGTGFTTYNDLMPYSYGDLSFHPRYEAKIFHYMAANLTDFRQYLNESTLFWIVGNVVDMNVVKKYV